MSESDAGALIEHFARACERMNDFSRSMWGSKVFRNVTGGADIRHYRSGWRLEKWVEAEIAGSDGYSACWWLEMGAAEGAWEVEGHLSISPDSEVWIELGTRLGRSPTEVGLILDEMVDALAGAIDRHVEFGQECIDDENRERIEKYHG